MWGGAETARRVPGRPVRFTRLLDGTCPLGRSPSSSSEALLIDSPQQDTLVWIARRARPSCPAFAAMARESLMRSGSILAAKQPTNLLDTNIVPVSVLGGRPTPAISSGPCGAPLARPRSRRCGAEPRQQGACRADRLLHRVVVRPIQ